MGKDRHEGEDHPRACLSIISGRNPRIKIAEGGNYCGLQLDSQGSDLKGQERLWKRSEITDFSSGSRRRLQRKLATINQYETTLPDFLTLTYPSEYSKDWRSWKRDMEAFRRALSRKYPNVWGVWRLEFQERGAPHYHFLLWDGPQVVGIDAMQHGGKYSGKLVTVVDRGNLHNQEVFDWLSSNWYRIVGSGDKKHLAAGTRIEPIQTWNGVTFYASKYLCKLPDGNFVPAGYEGTGRFWGVIGKDRWQVRFLEQKLSAPAWFKIKRVLRKRLERKGIDFGRMKRRGNADHQITDIGIQSARALALLAWAWNETGGCPF